MIGGRKKKRASNEVSGERVCVYGYISVIFVLDYTRTLRGVENENTVMEKRMDASRRWKSLSYLLPTIMYIYFIVNM